MSAVSCFPSWGWGRKDRGGHGLRNSSSFFKLGGVHVDVGDLDILGLELAAETGTTKPGTEDTSFIGVHVDRNILLSNSGLHGLLNHRRSECATGEDDRRDIVLQKKMSRRRTGDEPETHEGWAGFGQTCVNGNEESDFEVAGGGFEL